MYSIHAKVCIGTDEGENSMKMAFYISLEKSTFFFVSVDAFYSPID
jgi:hypothetical protein